MSSRDEIHALTCPGYLSALSLERGRENEKKYTINMPIACPRNSTTKE
tara:strand:+ start:3517 stop:3660 length:144 start_codon:yes stop_codon:yes gene_type:complete